VSSSEDKKDYS